MSQQPRQMSLGLNIIDLGAHPYAWRAGETAAHAYFEPDYYLHLARLAEKGRLDALFIADIPAVMGPIEQFPGGRLDPAITLATVAAATHSIGLIATASTSYNSPYNLARRFASLDWVSKGRAAWNVVASFSDAAARNFGHTETLDHTERYAKAEEMVQAVQRLWDSWEAGAIIGDRETGRFGDSSRLHAIDHAGPHFSVKGPLNVPRPPQGRPVLVQAGSSEGGKRLGARHADVIFTAQTTLDSARGFYQDMKARARRAGRNPEHLKIMPGLATVIGGTEAEAQARYEDVQQYVDEDRLIAQVAARTGIPAEALRLDQPLPWHLLPAPERSQAASHGFLEAHQALAREKGLTVRQLAQQTLVGHRLLVGTPEQVADSVEHWFRAGVVDGFNIIPERLPSGAEAFIEEVVPILQHRGVFRRDYQGPTLRHHLGLPVPASPFE